MPFNMKRTSKCQSRGKSFFLYDLSQTTISSKKNVWYRAFSAYEKSFAEYISKTCARLCKSFIACFQSEFIFIDYKLIVFINLAGIQHQVQVNMYAERRFQSAYPHSLVRFLVFRLKKCWTLGCPLSVNQRL